MLEVRNYTVPTKIDMGEYKKDTKKNCIGDKKKPFIINLNNWRNANSFYRTAADKNFRHYVSSTNSFDKYSRIAVVYTLFVNTKRSKDVMNVVSIFDKYFCDTLTEIQAIPDDDYNHLPLVVGMYGGMRKGIDEHIEVSIVDLEDATSTEIADTISILIRDGLFEEIKDDT